MRSCKRCRLRQIAPVQVKRIRLMQELRYYKHPVYHLAGKTPVNPTGVTGDERRLKERVQRPLL